MERKGYKAFAEDGSNIVGQTFPIGNYHCEGPISFGVSGNGFHFAKRLEDTIRYALTKDGVGTVLIAEVIGSGIIQEGWDDYYGYYDMYSASDLKIVKYLSRQEIIQTMLEVKDVQRIVRFVSLYRLTKEEQKLFYGRSFSIDLAIDYYQNNQKDVYQLEEQQKRLIKYRRNSY